MLLFLWKSIADSGAPVIAAILFGDPAHVTGKSYDVGTSTHSWDKTHKLLTTLSSVKFLHAWITNSPHRPTLAPTPQPWIPTPPFFNPAATQATSIVTTATALQCMPRRFRSTARPPRSPSSRSSKALALHSEVGVTPVPLRPARLPFRLTVSSWPHLRK